MNIIKLVPSINPNTLKDGRGGIYTFLPITDLIAEWSYIVTLKGSERGHHYHKEFDEYIMFMEGEGAYLELQKNETEEVIPISAGECIFIPKLTPHTFIPTADCKMLALITKPWDTCKEPIIKI